MSKIASAFNVSNMKTRLLLGHNSVWPQMYFPVCTMGLKWDVIYLFG